MIEVFDNFAPDALSVRTAVIKGGFKTMTGPDLAQYTGISDYPVPWWFSLIQAHLGRKIHPRLACFRQNLEGELPHSWVHSDGLCSTHAGVVYLNLPEQERGGTAFWRHRELKVTALPEGASLEYQKMIVEEWKKKDAWESYHLCPMKFNRFVTYPTSLYHSRFPFEGFGTTPETGRLVWACFYDVEAV